MTPLEIARAVYKRAMGEPASDPARDLMNRVAKDLVRPVDAQLRSDAGAFVSGKMTKLADLVDLSARPTDPGKVASYFNRMVVGQQVAPIDVTMDANGVMALSDGHHRLAAARLAGMDAIPCRIHQIEDTFGKSFSLNVPIAKVQDVGDKCMVYGWASVTHIGGVQVEDLQGDLIDLSDIRDAAHEFIKSARVGGLMHAQDPQGNPIVVGELVETLIMSPELEKALGIEVGKSGWLIGMEVTHPDVKKAARAGDLKAFSIGGNGHRSTIDATETN